MTDQPAFDVVNNEAAGRFEVHLDGAVAFAEYRLLASGILFPHTEVPAAFEGKGVGGALVRHALAFARERGLKVMPTCTFFAGYIAKHPEFHDLVHPDYRKALGIQA
jgi:predicted GNAT family acetyltransferase